MIETPESTESRPRLFCRAGDETMHLNESDAIEWAHDTTVGDVVEIEEFDTYPAGDSGADRIPDGTDLAGHVVERFWEDCGFPDAYEQLEQAAKRPEVIAAFQAARDLLVSHQTFLFARDRVATRTVRIVSERGEPFAYVAVPTPDANAGLAFGRGPGG